MSKFYLHYKNKPYKYVGVAKNSETQEDYVVYECLYPNDSAKLWIRPEKMFNEKIVHNGLEIPRFAKVSFKFKNVTELTETHFASIGQIFEKTLGTWDVEWFLSTYSNHNNFFLQQVFFDDQLIAFKLGYELDKTIFYSWLGGVLPKFQGLGIAADLMKQQHLWCKEKGYHRVQTKTQNRYKKMLALNIKEGFSIIGTHLSSNVGGLKIVLEKEL